MSNDFIFDWNRIIHKNVRDREMEDVGNIISISGNTITISQGRNLQYNIPKSYVEGYNGSEVILNANFDDLQKHRI